MKRMKLKCRDSVHWEMVLQKAYNNTESIVSFKGISG